VSHTVQIVRAGDFARLDAHGRVDLAASHEALAAVARACVERGTNLALLDVRDVYSDLSATELYSLAAAFNEMGFTRSHKLAVLHRYSGGERASFFARCAAERGWNVRAFESFEDAIDWFGAARAPGEG
jgi:hypothetical protein